LSNYRILSVETARPRGAKHPLVTAVRTQAEDPAADAERWTLHKVLQAMNRAERFYTQADNGRRARVQRYTCAPCHTEHIRTHVSDRAIHEIHNLPKG
jgi:hypothetical protein